MVRTAYRYLYILKVPGTVLPVIRRPYPATVKLRYVKQVPMEKKAVPVKPVCGSHTDWSRGITVPNENPQRLREISTRQP